MKKVLTAGACFLSAVTMVLAQAPNTAATPGSAPAATGPRIEFDTRGYEFGKVIQGEMIRHEFVVSNSGDQTLHITDVHPGCGCTTAGAWPHELAPGQSGKIPIQINSQNLSGNIRKTVTVTSDAKESRVILEMSGQVVKSIDVIPSFAMFHLIQGASNVAPAVVKITNHMDNPFHITSAKCETPAFGVGEIKTLTDGREYEITVTANPPFAHGTNGTILLGTSWSNYVIRVPAYLTVQAAVNYQPRSIMVPSELKQTNTYVVTLYSIRPEDRFTGATCPDERISVVLTNAGMNRPVYQLRATIPAGFKLEAGKTTFITVQTTDPQTPEIKIPVQQSRSFAMPATSARLRPQLPVASSTANGTGSH